MKRYIKSSEEFDIWYKLLSSDKKKDFDDFAYHNSITDYSSESETTLNWLKNQYEAQEEERLLDSERLTAEINEWYRRPSKGLKKFEIGHIYFEKTSLENIINHDIKWFNINVRESGDGFASDWDEDTWMYILYKNGKIRTVNPSDDDGTRRIVVDGIDSIIMEGGYGTTCAGPSIYFEDHTAYDDNPDIRATFDMSYWGK